MRAPSVCREQTLDKARFNLIAHFSISISISSFFARTKKWCSFKISSEAAPPSDDPMF